ncbi:MAG: hypothetical protein IJB86_06210 [Clostridia bacterium]|nr:hypothetical protein [Clostridia bacterium]
METLKFDLSKESGKFRIMHAVNNGPCHRRHANDQYRSNLDAFKEAEIPYARNHDAAFCATYGGEHSVDITGIFPNFDADENDPASYDFATTDEYIFVTLDAGTETFYRLGQKIEQYIKKFDTLPPKDFKKWAVICEHIIRHYNEGWADGYRLNIQYWEIWNEADLTPDDSTNKCTWGGTKAQFFEFYEIAAKHLKECFPHLKIGGPALAFNEAWANDFLIYMSERNVPIDFFSWHIYAYDVERITAKAFRIKKLLCEHGYGDSESILNEWNYVKGWTDQFVYSIKTINGMKGAAFTMAVMSACHATPVDMLMYYDARPCVFNGLFDLYTYDKLKGYYPFLWYSKLYKLQCEVVCDSHIDDIYTLCGKDNDGKVTAVITYYTDDDTVTDEKLIHIDFGKDGEFDIFLLDETHDGDYTETKKVLDLSVKPNTCIMIKER